MKDGKVRSLAIQTFLVVEAIFSEETSKMLNAKEAKLKPLPLCICMAREAWRPFDKASWGLLDPWSSQDNNCQLGGASLKGGSRRTDDHHLPRGGLQGWKAGSPAR